MALACTVLGHAWSVDRLLGHAANGDLRWEQRCVWCCRTRPVEHRPSDSLAYAAEHGRVPWVRDFDS